MEDNDINNNLIIKTLRKKQLSTEPRFYVYSYTDPTNNIVRYIGKGTRPRVFNIANHNNVVRAWNKNLRKINLKPIITLLHENLIEQEALDFETKYIKEYGNVFNHTGTLFNFKSIGTGSSGGFRQKRTSTLETKEKCRIASTGRKMSDETKRKMSEKKQNIKGTRRTPVIIYGVLYESISEAASTIGWTVAKLSKHLASGYYDEFKYQDELNMRLSIASRKNRRKSPGVSKNDLISLNNYKEYLDNIVLEKENKIDVLLNEIQEIKQNNISEKFLEEMELIRKEYVEYLRFSPPK